MIGERLKAARRAAGLTQEEVGRRVGVTSMAISKYERGVLTPSGERLVHLAATLGVGVAQLLRAETDLTLSAACYRWHPAKRRSRRAEEAVEARVREWLERYVVLEELVGEQPRATVPELKDAVGFSDDPEEAAERLRAHWQIGDDAIESVVDVLEDHGVKVLVLPEAGAMDACSYVLDDDQPVIAVSRTLPEGAGDCPGDRERFSLAHELAHFVIDGGASRSQQEAAAHRFAAAFLVPAASARRELGGVRNAIAVSEYALLKRKYGLSLQAWIRRSEELGILPAPIAKRYLNELVAAGFEVYEPVEVAFESPQRLLRLALRAWAEGIVSESRAAELSGCPREHFRRMRSDAREAVDARACA